MKNEDPGLRNHECRALTRRLLGCFALLLGPLKATPTYQSHNLPFVSVLIINPNMEFVGTLQQLWFRQEGMQP